MIKKMILITTVLLAQNVYADNIDKIFGLELGSVVNTKQDNFKRIDEDKNTATYIIDFKGFKTADVEFTATSKRIFEISASKEVSGYCPEELDIIAGILSKKYGELKKTDSFMRNYYSIRSGEKSLLVSCSGGLSDDYITINLYDNEIKEINKKEKIEIESIKELDNL